LKQGVVLFAHGSRDPEWARPFEQIAAALSGKLAVRLAYLEMMQPPLGKAIDALVADGCDAIRVVPVFLGQGGHVKHDLPRLVAAAHAAHPGVSLTLEKAIGERPAIIQAIADFISREDDQASP
jgi:sirohydrochlorin cobaltochelatase